MLRYFTLILFIWFNRSFAQTPSIDACIPVATITESQNNICLGATVTLHADIKNEGTGGVYKWKKNDHDVSVNNRDYTSTDFRNGDVLMCEYSCKTTCGIDTTVQSNQITIHVTNDVTPVISIANTDSLICEGELTVFTATASYGNALPHFLWTVNGDTVGTNSPLYTTSTLTNGSLVKCELTVSTPGCAGTSKPVTSQMTIYVYPMIHPAIKITPTKTDICRGEEVTFTATANGGAYPAFTWMINRMQAGPNAPTLSTSNLHEGDTISCIITIDQDSRCHTTTSAPSNDVVMHVRDYSDPDVKISAANLDICEGSPVIFKAQSQNEGDYKYYEWKINGKKAGGNSSAFIYDRFSDSDKVSCTFSTSIPGCPLTANVTSNEEMVTVRRVPEITFSPAEISVMWGESAQLKASVSSHATSFAWAPAGALLTPQSLTPATIPLRQDILFNLTVIDSNGCRANKNLPVKVLHKFWMPSAFTPNDDGKNDVFRIPSDASLSLYEFIIYDRWGNIVFKTKDISKGWDGTDQGKNLSTGAYIYFIKGMVQNKDVMVKGTVILLR